MSDNPDAVIADLDRLLEEERAALLDGDLAALDELLERKSVLIETLARSVAEAAPETLEPLQIKLRRNRELFDQALSGLRAVGDRLQALREVRDGSETYDGSGQRQSLKARARSRLEKRA